MCCIGMSIRPRRLSLKPRPDFERLMVTSAPCSLRYFPVLDFSLEMSWERPFRAPFASCIIRQAHICGHRLMLTPAPTFFMFTSPRSICLRRRGQKPAARLQKLEYTSNISSSLQVYVSYQPTLMHIYDLHVGRPRCEEIVTDFLERLYRDEGVHTS
jgi:hypothetical protein